MKSTPKRGDTKKIDGKTYRWGYQNGKWGWVRSYSKSDADKFAKKTGDLTKKNVGNFFSNTASKLGLHNKRTTKSTTNQKYSSDRWTKKPNEKLKTWRVDSNENKQLQTERKEGKDETYSRVTSKNKNNLSSQQNKKDSSKKTLGNESKEQYLERTKNSPAAKGGVGKEQRWAARQKHLDFLAKRKKDIEERRKKRLKANK